MIERVEEISAKLKHFRFGDPEVLENRNIEIVNWRQQERISSNVGLSSVASLNVSSIRIVCEIADYSSNDIPVSVEGACAGSTQRGHRTAYALSSSGIEDRAIAGIIAV